MAANIRIIIPARNEEQSIDKVLQDIAQEAQRTPVREVIVVDNGSWDKTHAMALSRGVTVLQEPQKGYGSACLRALRYLAEQRYPQQDIIVFVDADHADDISALHDLVAPVVAGCSLVVGSRYLGERLGKVERQSMTPLQRVGNRLTAFLLQQLYGVSCTDLGPFRAIRYADLLRLNMQDKDYGWTVEMQAKVLRSGLPYQEVPVAYRRRIGRSKISGTLSGALAAGSKILYTVGKIAIRRRFM